MVSQDLQQIKDILACPVCHSPVKIGEKTILCTNPECRRAYSVSEEGIPDFLVEDSTVKSPEEWKQEIEK